MLCDWIELDAVGAEAAVAASVKGAR
jgi:hypothetical protein